MKIHYAGAFNGDIDKLPHREHEKNAVRFNEPETPEELKKVGARVAPTMFLVESIPLFVLGIYPVDLPVLSFFAGVGLVVLTLPVHELLHAICFKEDVYIFSNLKRGMAFTVGTESMTKKRFVFMSLLPNVVLGLFPYTAFLVSRFYLGAAGHIAATGMTGSTAVMETMGVMGFFAT